MGGWRRRVLAAATKSLEDQAAKAAIEKDKDGGGMDGPVLYFHEYHDAQKAKRQGGADVHWRIVQASDADGAHYVQV